ncbi:MAG: Gfo/Idh/MocA family oxidoreductase [Planctomycetota bacterium]|jgi:predicted dehydrogenase|nr:Gfo/Idh/MocA family oxidoreductase [Planctomycetota bacterium]
MSSERIRLAILGARRGGGIIHDCQKTPVEVTAVCDVKAERIEKHREEHPGFQYFSDYDEMLAADVCDAVAIATPPPVHAEQAIKALKAGKHVYTEVIAGLTIDELWELVRTVEETGLVYTMAEQVNFRRHVLIIKNMIEQGVFGEVTYAQCGYIHDIKRLSVMTDGPGSWRYEWNFNRVGNYYPTHAIGPVSEWFDLGKSDRMTSLVSMSSQPVSMREYIHSENVPDDHPSKEDERPQTLGDVNKTLIQTAKGRLIDLWFDVNSNRPIPSTTHFEVQGSKAAWDYDYARHQRIYIKDRTNGWADFWMYGSEYEHPIWREHLIDWYQNRTGSTGRYMLQEFARSILEGTPLPIDVYDAADWSVIIPLSEESIRGGNKPVEFPNFREGSRS